MNHFSTGLWHAVKSGLVTARLVAGPRSSKALPKSKLATKKVVVTVCWLAACLIRIAFWILATLLHLRGMLSKWRRCTENCDACSWHWSTEWAQFFSTATPNSTSHNHASKVEQTGLRSFASSVKFTWPLTNWLPCLQASSQLFAEKMLPQQRGGRKCFPRVHWILKHRFLCYRNKQTRWQKCVDCNGSYFD